MSSGQNTPDDDTTRDDTPRDEQETPNAQRRAKRDAKRDMLDADKQDAYETLLKTTCLHHHNHHNHEARFTTTGAQTQRSRCDVPNESNGPQTIRQAMHDDEQETTDD